MVVPPRDAARAIVIKDGNLLVMKRHKPIVGDYVVLLGGRLEPDELPQEAVVREVMEESTLVINNPKLVFIEEPHERWGKQYVFLCDYVSGKPVLDPSSEEHAAQLAGHGTFEPVWMPIEELERSDAPFRTERLKQELLEAIRSGFPEQPKRWTP